MRPRAAKTTPNPEKNEVRRATLSWAIAALAAALRGSRVQVACRVRSAEITGLGRAGDLVVAMRAAPAVVTGHETWVSRANPVTSIPVILDARRAQPCQAVRVDGPLPRQELVHREFVALTGFLEAEQPTANGSDHFSLPADNPALGIARRKIGDSQWAAVRSNHVARSRSELLIGHGTRYTLSDLRQGNPTRLIAPEPTR